MKKILIIAAILLLAYTGVHAQAGVLSAFRANYFVSSAGNDANSGKYPWAAIKTIEKLNTLTPLPGQIVALRYGDTFTGTLTVAASGTSTKPITFTAYGKPSLGNPLVNTIICDTLVYTNVAIKNIDGDKYYNKTYFVSNTGSDDSTGLTPETAWATIAKVNATDFEPGDQILFKRGDEWLAALIPKTSGTEDNPITYGAYGTGVKPLIYGADTIDGWHAVTPSGNTNNLITNGGFETNTSGWTFYQATGGATTIARTTSSPLVGSGSLSVNNTSAGSNNTSPSILDLAILDGTAGLSMAWGFKYRVNSGTFILFDLNAHGPDLNLTLTGTGTFIDTVSTSTNTNFNPRFDGRNLFDVTIDSVFAYIIGEDPQSYVWATNADMPLTSYYCVINDTIYGERVNSISQFTEDYQFVTTTDSIWVSTSNFTDTANIRVALIQESIVSIKGKSNLVINDLHLRRTPVWAVDISMKTGVSSDNITINNCTLEESPSTSIMIRDTSTNITITNDSILNNISNGLYMTGYSNHIDVYDNYFENNGLGESGDRQGIGIWMASNVDIHDNYIDHTTGFGSTFEFSCPNGIWANDSIDIYNNALLLSKTKDHAIQLYSGRFNMYNNLIIGDTINSVSVLYTGRSRSNALSSGFAVRNYVNFYNNTIDVATNFVKMALTTGYTVSDSCEFNFKNNIFSNIKSDYVTEYDVGIDSLYRYIDFDYNLYSSDSGTKWEWLSDTKYNFADWKTATGLDAHSLVGNPLFVGSGNYSLQTGSPAINAGLNVGITTDILGNPVPSGEGYDIGAYERQ